MGEEFHSARKLDGLDDYVCPQCGAEYKSVQVSASSVLPDSAVHCLHCQAEFPARNGNFILKYFLLRRSKTQLRPLRTI